MNKQPYQVYTDFCDELIVKEHEDETISCIISEYENCYITHTKVLAEENVLEKEIGDYITIEFDDLHDHDKRLHIIHCLYHKLLDMFKQIDKDIQKILIVGLGNRSAVSDALGPKCSEQILVTAHFYEQEDAPFLDGTRNVAMIAPGVMGQTGLESAKIVKATASVYQPDVIIAIDALATSSTKRINRAIQINNTGISPGGGVGNHRLSLNEKTMQIPVIAIGVATVTSIGTILKEATQSIQKESLLEELHDVMDLNLIVTPKNMDDELRDLVTIVSEGINSAIHPNYQNL